MKVFIENTGFNIKLQLISYGTMERFYNISNLCSKHSINYLIYILYILLFLTNFNPENFFTRKRHENPFSLLKMNLNKFDRKEKQKRDTELKMLN